jgi:acetyl esterase/lipase
LPNYRLAPEHSGDDILDDIADFHTWFRDTLPVYLDSKNSWITLDFDRVLVHGDSAGGWCALQSVLSQPKSTFRACLLQYPVLSAFPTSPEDKLMGQAIPPKEELDKFLASIVPDTIISSATPPARSWVAPMLRAYGRWKEFFGDGKHVMPDTRIEDAEFWVPTYIIHGRDDTVVPVKWTHVFVGKARGLFPDVKVEVVTPPGDHGFDGEMYEEDEAWLKEVLEGVEASWPACRIS